MNMSDREHQVAVVGAGSWGTALSCHLAGKGIPVDLWVYEDEIFEQIRDARENKVYLPGITIPELVRPHRDLETVAKEKTIVMMVTPTHVTRQVLSAMSACFKPGVILVSASKGVENDTLMTMSGLMEDVLPGELAFRKAVFSGPSFAREVSRGLPAAVTVASSSQGAARAVQELFSSPAMRVYTSQDMTGVELGGSLKNVYAIGAGIADGLGLGTNARAAMITRSLAEMSRLGVKMGANPLTFMGLAGMGDLVLTCTGDLSRNRTVGLKLGQGMKLKQILAEMKMVAEGVKTTKSVHDLSLREKVDMPLAEEVYRVLYEEKDPKKALHDLMTRDLKEEIDRDLAMV